MMSTKCSCGRVMYHDVHRCPLCGRLAASREPTCEPQTREDLSGSAPLGGVTMAEATDALRSFAGPAADETPRLALGPYREPLQSKSRMPARRVVVRTTFEHVVEVPNDWDKDMVEFHFNESSSCSNNMLSQIQKLHDRLSADKQCLCSRTEVVYVRDATNEDLERDGLAGCTNAT